VVIDPTIVTESKDVYLDINIYHDRDYGRALAWDDKSVLQTYIRKVHVVKEMHVKRFEDRFIKSIAPPRRPRETWSNL
jgi:hypothetical protein